MKVSPSFRISFGLVLITLSILLSADLLGLTPNNTKFILDERKHITEALAIEFSLAAQEGHVNLIKKTIRAIVERNDDIISAGLRQPDGSLATQAGGHAETWLAPDNKRSTPTHVIVPIHKGNDLWASVEIQFTPIQPLQIFGVGLSPLNQLLLFMAMACFVGFIFLIHRTLRYLNPSAVVPGRVQFALDALSSGVVLLDDTGGIIVANNTFSALFDNQSVLGKNLNAFNWKGMNSNRALTTPPLG